MALKNQVVSVRTKVAMMSALIVVLSLVLPSSSFLNRLTVRTVLADTGTGSVSLTTIGTAATENFDTLSNTAGSTTNTTLPTGWYITETGGGARDNEQYAVDTGASTTGDIYSYGAAAATDRALGALRSGTLIPLYGAKFTNNTGSTITSLDVAYTGEEWRLGTAARTDQINFEISTNATDLSTGTYTGVATLNFITPDTATTGAKNGNAAADRTAISASISSLSIPNGASFFIRWTDTDATGADDGLAVDDFSITPQGAGGGPLTLSINDVTQAEGNSGTTAFNFTVSLTGPAGAGGVTFNASTADGTATAPGDYTALVSQPGSISVGNTSTTVTVQVNGDLVIEANETFFVNIANVVGANPGDVQGLGTITNDDIGLTPIHTIQGSGTSSPLVSTSVTTSGIVTGVKSNGFFIQEPDASVDADPNTSEGILVFTSSAPPAAAVVGNNVQVSGTVAEFIPASDPGTPSTTELTSPTVTLNSTGNAPPAAITITSADTGTGGVGSGSINNLEKFEGMRVHVNSLTVGAPTGGSIDEVNATSTSFGDFYGVITGVARPFREPGIETPYPVPTPYPSGAAPASVPIFDANPERIRVNSLGLVGATDLQVATNAVVTNITGPLDYGFRTYTIDPDPSPVPSVAGGMTAVAVPVPNTRELTIGSFNMQRFFDTTDDPSVSDVVLTTTAFNNRLNKASLAIRNIMQSPDVIGIEEMENLTTLQSVATKVNADSPAGTTYQAFLVEGNDVGGIDVAFLVKTQANSLPRITVNSVTQYNKTETFIDPNTAASATLNDRPPLVLRASIVQPSGATLSFSVVVNHLRSLGSVTLTTNAGAHTRVKKQKQAESLATLINEMQNGGARQVLPFDQNIVSVGDYNAFQFNDGYTDVMGTVRGVPTPASQVVESSPDLNNPDLTDLIGLLTAAQQYSYTFGGNAQALDHTIVNQNMLNRFSRFAYARMDADFPDSFRNDPNRPERISDHDPEVAYFNMAVVPTAANGVVSGRVTDQNGIPIAGAVVNLSGTQNRKFITDANGSYRFDNVETNGFYTVKPTAANYSFSPGERSFSQVGNTTEAAFTGSRVAIGLNPIETPEYFVRQHYLDFLAREPDESGFNFWSDQMLSCGDDAACSERRAVNVSAAYFLSIEFQQTGGFVDGLHRVSYGVRPQYAEFMPEARAVGQGVIVGNGDWAQRLAANKQAFIDGWVTRPEFRAAYDGLSNSQFVDALLSHTGVSFSPGERDALVSSLTNGATRAEVLANIADDGRFVNAKRNEMFVMMQYFGYLRRDPDAAGYQFWLNKLNQFGGNFEQAEMVKAFIVSGEYRARFAR